MEATVRKEGHKKIRKGRNGTSYPLSFWGAVSFPKPFDLSGKFVWDINYFQVVAKGLGTRLVQGLPKHTGTLGSIPSEM